MSNSGLERIFAPFQRLELRIKHISGRGCKLAQVLLLTSVLGACSQQIAVSVNNQAVFDPNQRLPSGEALNPDLQGCINLSMRQQLVTDPAQLNVLSCANSDIDSLINIGKLVSLRFLDLGGNSISNITPLETLQILGGLNLANNQITDISVLFNLRSLVSVSLDGNNNIPCTQINALKTKLGTNFTPPQRCKN